MNTNDLNVFEAVASHGSFTKAAEAMFTVQSNVTARIKSLEAEFGAPLFTRNNRKVELTPAGETLMKYSRQLNQLIDEAKRAISKSDVVKGLVKVGFIETMMTIKGPELVNKLYTKYPSIELEFKSAMRESLVNDVLNYRLDAAFVPAPVDAQELAQIKTRDEEIVVVAPVGYKNLNELLQKSPVRTIVFEQGCVFRARSDAWLAGKGIVQYHKTVMNSVEGIVNFIESGIGFSFLPAEVIAKFYRGRKIKTFPIPGELGRMSTILVYRKDVPASPALKAFISFCDV